jgi:hypothetical protein
MFHPRDYWMDFVGVLVKTIYRQNDQDNFILARISN